MARSYPAAPILAILQVRSQQRQVGIDELADTLRVPPRTLQRTLTRHTLRWDTADRLAIALGHHPSELWPDWFDPIKETA